MQKVLEELCISRCSEDEKAAYAKVVTEKLKVAVFSLTFFFMKDNEMKTRHLKAVDDCFSVDVEDAFKSHRNASDFDICENLIQDDIEIIEFVLSMLPCFSPVSEYWLSDLMLVILDGLEKMCLYLYKNIFGIMDDVKMPGECEISKIMVVGSCKEDTDFL